MVDPAVEVLLAIASGDTERAADLAARATGDLCAALAIHLEARVDAVHTVYDEARAFQAFISHGSNPLLYERTIASISRTQRRTQPRSVLDIGCGDGRISAASRAPSVTRLDLVEPAAAMLAEARDRLGDAIDVHCHGETVECFLAESAGRWDLAQATFSMHNLEPASRPAVWHDLARRTRTLLICEFDVPSFPDRSEAHCRYLAERYAVGIAEYADLPEVVQGFLMPVLVGQVALDAAPRYTFEQPVARWREELEAAGFSVTRERVFSYWWADAWMLVGESTVSGDEGEVGGL